ncbi:MAG: BlaI/MecI/CopY family transcriptional regulator [Acidobacteriota bacterium]
MKDKKQIKPTDAELNILGALWEMGPSTVRDIHSRLARKSSTGYTTILKILQIMTEKELVVRDESDRAHVYTARYSEQKTQRQLVGDLLDRAFNGSTSKLVLQALSAKRTDAEELREIRALLDELEKKR